MFAIITKKKKRRKPEIHQFDDSGSSGVDPAKIYGIKRNPTYPDNEDSRL